MINLKNDYCYIAHPLILEKLNQNREYTYNGYGFDEYTTKAVNLIKETFKCRKANVYFLPGGTITNKIAIAHSLKPYEAVICVDSGHINTHETGAIEQTGHKISAAARRADSAVELFQFHPVPHDCDIARNDSVHSREEGGRIRDAGSILHRNRGGFLCRRTARADIARIGSCRGPASAGSQARVRKRAPGQRRGHLLPASGRKEDGACDLHRDRSLPAAVHRG